MRTVRHPSGSMFVTSLLALALGACGVAVAPYDGGGGGDGGPGSDATRPDSNAPDDRPDIPPGCRLPDGTIVPFGATTVASDGCNTCTCQPNGSFACTELACVDSSVPEDEPVVGGCQRNSECGRSAICSAPPGCGTPGTCVRVDGCTADVVEYCMCDGTTATGSSSCPPGVFLHRGPCATDVDAGERDEGVDASVDTGVPPGSVDCNPGGALCFALPPECPPGTTNSVRNRCWGDCVPIRSCFAIRCTPTGTPGGGSGIAPPPQNCPQNTYCDSTTRVCVEDSPRP